MPVVVTSDLCRDYGSRRGIRNVSLSIERGEIFGFLGPNGAGKSTTIRILTGLLRAGSGSARIFDRDCWVEGTGIRQEIGYVAGDVRLYPWLTTRRALKMLSQIRGRDVLRPGLDYAGRFRLEPDLPVRKMSRGNRQKVALVLAVAHRPALLVLDEPASGLDPLMQDTLMLCLRELAADGHTVLFSSHTLSEVESLCNHVAVIRDGRIVEDATLASLRQRAPRQIVVTMADQRRLTGLRWPDGVSIVYQAGSETEVPGTSSLQVAASLRDRSCVLELHGSSAAFLAWAAAQDFEDVSIGVPSLEALFRKYYQE
jgi:ABC-2 type transport system ATP-binding protein